VWVAGRTGTVGLAAYTVASNVWNLLALALDALAIAAQALVGHALGAHEPDLARSLTRRLTWWGAGYGVLTGLLILAAAPLVDPLLAPDPAVRAALGPIMLIIAALQPACGVVFLLDGVLIGAGDGAYLAWAGLACTAVFIPMALPVVWLHLSISALWLAVGGQILARLIALTVRARGSAWMRLGGV
jgi:Na+-driven multidrug efflux pump